MPQPGPEDIGPLESTGKTVKHRSLRSDVWRQFRRHKGAVVGLVLLVLIVLFSYVGPWLWGVDPQALDVAAKNQGPSWTHPFGTDNLGRDVMAQVMEGGKISLLVGLTAMLIGVFVGMTIGVLAGFFRSLDACSCASPISSSPSPSCRCCSSCSCSSATRSSNNSACTAAPSCSSSERSV